jgi:4-hydroxythreonine-4-phosphate dehydrogenase
MAIAFTPGEPAGIGPDLAVIYAQKKSNKNTYNIKRVL